MKHVKVDSMAGSVGHRDSDNLNFPSSLSTEY